jgi:hypothetical protein
MLLWRSWLLALGLRFGLGLPSVLARNRIVLAMGIGDCDSSDSERAHLGKRAQEEEPGAGKMAHEKRW